jgi:hypothetical protein
VADMENEPENEPETAKQLGFIEAQTKRLKKIDPEDLSPLKLSRAVAALADMTDETPPDATGTAFLAAWKRTENCHHFWGPTVGSERFCTKCQVPRSAAAADDVDVAPARRRT